MHDLHPHNFVNDPARKLIKLISHIKHKHAPIHHVYNYIHDCTFTPCTFIVSASPTASSTLPHQCNMANPVISTTPQTNIPPSPSTASRTLATKSVELNYVPLVALGALLGLSLLLLVVVTTGWVCTCVSMKKREAKVSSTHTRYARIAGLNNHGDHVH